LVDVEERRKARRGSDAIVRTKRSLMRRSGIAIYQVAELLGWQPTAIFQVGVGQYCKEVDVFAEAWPEADLIGFEPNPEVLRRIKYPGLIVRKALGRYVGWAKLFCDPAHVDGASVYNDTANGKLQESDVEIDTLDHYYDGVKWHREGGRVMLWLDCEGSELDVLVGGERFVEHVQVINVELTGKALRAGWPNPAVVNRWLLNHGFLLQFVHTQRMAVGQCDAVYVRPELLRPEYCSCPLMVEEWKKGR